jgi:hypothetical protein
MDEGEEALDAALDFEIERVRASNMTFQPLGGSRPGRARGSRPKCAGTGPKFPCRPQSEADAPGRPKRPENQRAGKPAHCARIVRAVRRFWKMLSWERFLAVWRPGGPPGGGWAPPPPVCPPAPQPPPPSPPGRSAWGAWGALGLTVGCGARVRSLLLRLTVPARACVLRRQMMVTLIKVQNLTAQQAATVAVVMPLGPYVPSLSCALACRLPLACAWYPEWPARGLTSQYARAGRTHPSIAGTC